jgi:hypothetical protein
MSYNPASSKKRKANSIDKSGVSGATSKKRRREDAPAVLQVEKRQARYKPGCPANIRERMERVVAQRPAHFLF